MTRKIGDNILVIEPEPPDRCAFCKKYAELRPYGPKGERICFECGMKDEATTRKMFGKLLT